MLTIDQQQKIADVLASMPKLANGIGTEEKACSIAAINLALTGELTDRIPDCMSNVIGQWIIKVQDTAPAALCRDNPRWRTLLPLAAGTGRTHEKERRAILMDWLWVDVLPQVQHAADARGFGKEWKEMCEKRTCQAANEASVAAAKVASAASEAISAARAAVAAWVISAARAAQDATEAAEAAAGAVRATNVTPETFWEKADPCSLLEKLINGGNNV